MKMPKKMIISESRLGREREDGGEDGASERDVPS